MQRKVFGIVGVVLFISLIGFGWWYNHQPVPSEQTQIQTEQEEHTVSPSEPNKGGLFSSKEKKLIFYVNKTLAPEVWVKNWETQNNCNIEQRLLPAGELPQDGDAYALSPEQLGALKNSGVSFMSLPEDDFFKTTDPVFLGHRFDLDNVFSRPWRWSPYLFYIHRSGTTNPVLPVNWWKEEKAMWPETSDLLVALRMKEYGASANLERGTLWNKAQDEINPAIASHLGNEQACWEALRAEKIEITFLPAALRLAPPMTDLANLAWFAPAKGTLVQFDVLVINEKTALKEQALSWLEFLRAEPQQKELCALTGYFPVRGSEASQPKTTIPLPPGSWFSKSEFLLYHQPPKAIPVEDTRSKEDGKPKEELKAKEEATPEQQSVASP